MLEQNRNRGLGRHIIQSIEGKELKKRPFAIRLADNLTAYFGSTFFFTINVIFFAIWILVNSGKVPGIPVFDPFPFILLTMTVSLEAIFLSIFVLMSQNRQSYISTLREELDMQVNLVAEREITKVLKLLKLIIDKDKLEIKDPELTEMLKETDIPYIERKLEEQINTPKNVLEDVIK